MCVSLTTDSTDSDSVERGQLDLMSVQFVLS